MKFDILRDMKVTLVSDWLTRAAPLVVAVAAIVVFIWHSFSGALLAGLFNAADRLFGSCCKS